MEKIAIIGAMKIEIELIKEKMEIKRESVVGSFTFFEGTLEGRDIVLTSCGIGKVNAACCSQLLIDKFCVSKIINTGIAGTLNEKVGICDIVISENVTYHDFQKEFIRYQIPDFESFSPSKILVEKAKTVCEKLCKDKYHIGRIVTGDAFIKDRKIKDDIAEKFSPLCVEMEGAAIAQVCHLNGIEFLILRCISDNADDVAEMTYDSFEKIAAETSANIIINLINEMNV